MFKIIKTMKSQWKAVIVVVLLLFVQAICDLSLPNYTSQLIDVGIQNSGVEYATPTVIRAEQFEKVQMFMTEEERTSWQSAYALGEDGVHKFSKTYYEHQDFLASLAGETADEEIGGDAQQDTGAEGNDADAQPDAAGTEDGGNGNGT